MKKKVIDDIYSVELDDQDNGKIIVAIIDDRGKQTIKLNYGLIAMRWPAKVAREVGKILVELADKIPTPPA